MTTQDDLIGKDIDQFRIDEFIGQGAMGVVYKAFDKILHRSVALKLIPKGQGGLSLSMVEARKRLIQEAQAAGCLSHPNIVTIHSYGETDEFQYICMEYIVGQTLSEVLSEKKFLSVTEAIYVVEQILLALEVAHKEQIVHRDIKPTNIMILPDGRAKVMDFGIAKIPSLHLTTTGTVLGTPYYMSPEQITGQSVDIQSDLFAVGAVFYQIITGVKPFEGETTVALAYKIVEVEPVPPRILKTNIPQAVENIIKKALSKNSGTRYQTPRQMLDDLQAYRNRETEAPQRDFETTVRLAPSAPSASAPSVEKDTGAKISFETPEPTRKPADGKRPEDAPATALPEIEISAPPQRPDPTPKAAAQGKGEGNAFKTVAITIGLLLAIGAGIFGVMRFIKPSSPAKEVPVTKESVKEEEPPSKTTGKKPAQDVDSLIRKAKIELQNNPDNARVILEQAVSLDPNHFEANYQMGRLLTFIKEYSKAIPFYEKALQLDKRVPEIPFNLGYIYMNQGNFDEAIKYYEICRDLSPPFQDEVLTNLGLCHLKKKNVQKARVLLKEALRLNPQNSKAQTLLKSIKG
jgi:eukaryotic-like serine/threonine-protein kinase